MTDSLSFLPDRLIPDLDYPNRFHREVVLYDFDKLDDLPMEVKSPKFVYAHIVAPHKPIVFGSDGEWVSVVDDNDAPDWRRAYTAEIQYVNTRMENIVKEIISVSAIPPIIIIQADHGAAITFQENYSEILNAYYLPNGGETYLYPSISPVNTFRVIFNHYFGTNYPLLENKSYLLYYDTPFEFTQVAKPCPKLLLGKTNTLLISQLLTVFP